VFMANRCPRPTRPVQQVRKPAAGRGNLPGVILRQFPPMGVYETLFRFAEATQKYMGDPGTHPWAQGFPLTTQVPGGPSLPDSIAITATDRMYPKADGQPPLRQAIADYYNEFYGSNITPDNVAVFAGGRPAIFAILAFLLEDVTVAIEETEYASARRSPIIRRTTGCCS